jgi:hypothetical protein
MLPIEFEPIIPSSERPQTHALDRAASVIGINSKDFRSSYQPTGYCEFHISTTTSSKQNVEELRYYLRQDIMHLGYTHQSVTRALENNLSYSKSENRH